MSWLWLLLAARDVPDGGRFPFQQSVSPGTEPPVSQVGQARTAWQQYSSIHKPRRCCGIWETRAVSDLDQFELIWALPMHEPKNAADVTLHSLKVIWELCIICALAPFEPIHLWKMATWSSHYLKQEDFIIAVVECNSTFTQILCLGTHFRYLHSAQVFIFHATLFYFSTTSQRQIFVFFTPLCLPDRFSY